MVRIVVRRLGVGEEDVVGRFEALALEGCRFQYFVAGKKSKRRGVVPGRLYCACPEQAEGRVINSLKVAFPDAVVERAAFDKVFREPSRRDKREGTWLKSAVLAAFEKGDPVVEASKEVTKTSALVEFVNSRGSLFKRQKKDDEGKKKRQRRKNQEDAPKKPSKTSRRKKDKTPPPESK